jgi:hypothetical protein
MDNRPPVACMIGSRVRAGFALACFSVISSHCVPVEPAERRLIGKWQVEWKCGKETLEFRTDKTYTQGIEYAAGGRADHSGAWRVTAKESHLEGGHVVLQDALEFCTVFGEKLPVAQRADRSLETIWEWGRLTLSFNPDDAGFTRQ